MSAFDGGFNGSLQHPLPASNENTDSMLVLYLFKGPGLSRDFQSHQSRFDSGCAEPLENSGFQSPGHLQRAVLRRSIEIAALSRNYN
jgi:hypothetical protein